MGTTTTDQPSLPARPTSAHASAFEGACPECGATRLEQDPRRGETVCPACGLVLSDRAIDPGPDWRAYDHADRQEKARAGPARTIMRHDHGLGTQIGYEGSGVSSDTRARLSRMRRYHRRATYRSSSDRELIRGLTEIERIAGALGLPDHVAQTAARTFRSARDKDFLMGRSVDGTAAASVYIASRVHELPRQLEELSDHARVDQREVARTFRKLTAELGITVPLTAPEDLLPAISSKLGLPAAVEHDARRHLEQLPEARRSGKKPASLAAAAVYKAALEHGEHRSQDAVAQAAGVTGVTLRSRLGDFEA